MLFFNVPIHRLHTEIAKLQNISRSGVFQNRHYALKQMKKSLEEEH